MRSCTWKTLIPILLAATLLRWWGTFDFAGLVGDEDGFTTFAKSLFSYGVGDWKYAPGTDLILGSTIALFGDNPVGWRISGIVLGTLAVLLVYLIGRRLYAGTAAPLLAAALLAFDPFHIHFCRTITQETPVVCFFLLYLYLMLEYCEGGRRTLTLAGLALGLTIATKVYFVFAIPAVAGFAFWRTRRRCDAGPAWGTGVEFAAKLVLLPLSVYLLAHFLWFGRGHTLPELVQLKSDAFWVFGHHFTFQNAEILKEGGKPWQWFLFPFSFGHQLFSDGQYGRFAIQINNPLFRMLVLPALAVVGHEAWRTRSLREALVPLLFVSCYLVPLLAPRPMNSYSALVLLPAAYLALARAVAIVAARTSCAAEAAIVFGGAVVVSGCYLFPLAAGFTVPIALYQPVLSLTNLTGAF